ncbi:MAG: type II toxin-antitoxin system RelE/ParE family toxin [Rhodospirillaceae bacterium]|nr:type II toxin-antitoxin system RelE/ParE family toxin [Rhodospirillaceae bacterium]
MQQDTPQKIPLVFYRTRGGNEPVREWLKSLPADDRKSIGADLARVQYRWPIGMPLCKPMGNGLWEVRTTLPSQRIARVLFCVFEDELWALHGFIKKTAKTPAGDLALAQLRKKEIRR